jgi:tRNA threonylcarbamoyladenosine biosynthesis protein TsaB
MRILAIDTSTDYLSIAVTDGARTLARFHRKVGRRHSDLLIPTIKRLIKECGLKLKDIEGLSVGIGPGSFTGLRIAVTTAKGLAHALRIPVVTVPTLDAIAANAGRFRGNICPVLDARKGKLYACLYRSDGKDIKRIWKYLLLTAGGLAEKISGKNALLLGDGMETVKKTGIKFSNGIEYWQPRAETIGRLALTDFRNRRFTKPEDLEPLYLYSRECDIKGY